MKKLLNLSFLVFFSGTLLAQNVGIGTSTPQEKLEVKNPLRSAVKISSNSFNDTTQLVFSNRTIGNAGTDFNFSSERELGLKLSTASDIGVYNVDPILMIKPNGLVGIRNPAPAEELDVTGNINVTGTIKADGIDGSPGQVLMKNSIGNMTWGDFPQYKHVIGFPSSSSTLTNTSHSWTIPVDVTKILVEAWGGGGGGAVGGGGGGGGYAAVEWTVVPGTSVSITIGAAGAGATSSAVSGSYGNNTTVNITGVQLTAYGGSGGYTNSGGFPGRWLANSSTLNVYGQSGAPGEATSESYGQYNSTSWYTAIHFGSGGQGGNTSLANKNGGFRSFDNSTTALIENNFGQIGSEPGGGGGGHVNGGRYGGPGLVIIHY